MAGKLIDLLWRDHPSAPQGGRRGPRAKVTTSTAVDTAVVLADRSGLDAVTLRALATELGISPMALYTHVDSRDDLLVLMADLAHARQSRPRFGSPSWRTRVREIAEADLALHTDHPWLVDITDQRISFGPGTIAKYDHELHAFDDTPLGDVERDAALTFVLDFVRASARARRPDPRGTDMAAEWAATGERLAEYVGADHPLAQRVGAASGAAMNTSYDPQYAWHFGLERVLDALGSLIRAAR